MMIRYFVRLNEGGIVDQDLTVERERWGRVQVPENLVEVTDHPQWTGAGSLIGKRLNGDEFEDIAPARQQVVSLNTFMLRFTFEEQVAFQALLESDRRARVWMQRLEGAAADRRGLDLDAPEMIAGLQYLKAMSLSPSTPAEAKVWADAETADARIAAIRGLA